jgi:hypothetical protein
MKTCKGGYSFAEIEGRIELITPSGVKILENEINPLLLFEYKSVRRRKGGVAPLEI